MILEEKFLKALIEIDNPIELIWEKINEIWNFEKTDNLSKIYLEKEKIICEFEKAISKIFFEIYDELTKNIMQNVFFKEFPKNKGEVIIIMDGFSIREAQLFFKRFDNKNYIIDEYGYTFSSLPSNTGAMRQKFELEFYTVATNEDIDRISSLTEKEKIIWCMFPDALLHSKQKGKIQVLTIDECIEKTFNCLFSIIDVLDSKEIIITADHGYLYFPEYDTWWNIGNKKIDKILREIFGAERFKRLDELNENILKIADELSEKGYLGKTKEYIFVKGRYFWSVTGMVSQIHHGGLSFMECLVPVIKLKRS